MYIKADQEKQKRLSIVMVVIVVGFVLSHQSFYVIPVIAQTNQNNVNAETVSPTIYEIELAVKELPQGPIAYKLNKYIQKDNNNN